MEKLNLTNPNIFFIITLIIISFLFNACLIDQKLTKKDKKLLGETSHPYTSSLLYSDALSKMGEYINKNVGYKIIIQPKPINNITGGQELPVNVTDMVITAISRLAGDKIIVAPYDPVYVSNDAKTGGLGSRLLPTHLIGGSITEFDKDVSATSRDINLDLLLGGGSSESDTGIELSKEYRLSRVALDLYMLDYKKQAVVPGVSISNTVNILEIERGQDFGFAIFGSGLGITGRIKHSQGFQRALRNLVEYSVLQLLGRYYDLPYWRLLGINRVDKNVIHSVKKAFLAKSHKHQLIEIQYLLRKLKLRNVRNPITGEILASPPINGHLDPQTLAFIAAFIDKYAPETNPEDLTSLYIKLRENTFVPRLAKGKLIANIHKEEETSVQRFYDRFDKFETVYQQDIEVHENK